MTMQEKLKVIKTAIENCGVDWQDIEGNYDVDPFEKAARAVLEALEKMEAPP